MTTPPDRRHNTATPSRSLPWLRLALAAFALGVGTFGLGARFSYLGSHDLPYESSQISMVGDKSHIEIRTQDAKVYTFTGDPWELQDWVWKKTAELRVRYGVDAREELGNRLIVASYPLIGLGLFLLGAGVATRYGNSRRARAVGGASRRLART
jgi:hypothetical protein